MATNDTKLQAGVDSPTTVHVCNGVITDGNECQHIALRIVAGRLHRGKPNRN